MVDVSRLELRPQDLEAYRNDPAMLERLNALPPLERMGVHAVASSNRGFWSTASAALGFRDFNAEEIVRYREHPIYLRVMESLTPGAGTSFLLGGGIGAALSGPLVHNHPAAKNIAAATAQSFDNQTGVRGAFNFIGFAARKLFETGSFGEFLRSMTEMVRFSFSGNGPIRSAWGQEFIRESTSAAAAELSIRLADPHIGLGRTQHAAVVQGVLDIAGQRTGVSMADTPFANAFEQARSFTPATGTVRRDASLRVPSDGPVISHESAQQQLALLTSLSGLAIHLPPRAGQQAAHTDAATLKARREITPRELFFLRQDEQGPVRDHWNNFMRARFTQVNHGTRPEGAPFQAFLHQQEGSFRNPESRGYVEFQTYLTQMRPPYLRAHLERDIAAGRFSQPLANAALGVRPAAVTQLTPEEFIADVRGRGPVFQREVKQLIDSGRTPEIAIAEVTTRLTELSERAHPYGTGITRPTTEDLSRHRQAVLDNRPLPEAVTAVATLASPRIHAQRAQFVGSELQPLLPLIEREPVRFGLTAEDVRTLSQRRFAGDDPTGVRRVALTDAELQAAGITRSDITVSQPVSLARTYYTRHEAELLAAMPPALLN